jgi:hypothetical protein
MSVLTSIPISDEPDSFESELAIANLKLDSMGIPKLDADEIKWAKRNWRVEPQHVLLERHQGEVIPNAIISYDRYDNPYQKTVDSNRILLDKLRDIEELPKWKETLINSVVQFANLQIILVTKLKDFLAGNLISFANWQINVANKFKRQPLN